MTGMHAFMTNRMKADLRACGFSEEQLRELSPQEGDEILAAASIVVPDSHEVRKFIEIIVAQAKAATKHLKEPGLLQVSLLHPLSEDLVPYRYALDNPKLVEQMTREIVSASEAGHNVYIEARTVRRGLRGKKRGEAEDTVAVFALVVDSDADKGEAGHEHSHATARQQYEQQLCLNREIAKPLHGHPRVAAAWNSSAVLFV